MVKNESHLSIMSGVVLHELATSGAHNQGLSIPHSHIEK